MPVRVVVLRWTAENGQGTRRMEFTKMRKLFKERKIQMDSVCNMQSVKSYHQVFPPVPDIFHYYPRVKAAVCKTRHLGTVILPKIMNILDSKLPSGKKKFDLTQYSIDDLKFNINIDILRERDEVDVNYIIIGRNPYDRILAHYIEGMSVVSELNRQIGRTFRKPMDKVTLDGKSFICGFQVDFQDYADYLLQNILKPGFYNADLELPIVRQCAPCNVKYTYMFKQETLTDDIFQIMNATKMNPVYRKIINQLLDGDIDERSLYLDEYVTETMAYHRHHKQDCPETLALLYKLWRSLQNQGILHADSKFPLESFVKLKGRPTIVTDTIRIIREDVKHNPLTIEQRDRQRQEQFRHYDLLNQITMDKIKVAYKVDFIMFGYDSSSPPGDLKRKAP